MVFLVGPVEDYTANVVVAQMLFWSPRTRTRTFTCTSIPPVVVTAGMAIYDTMQYIKPDVSTICVEQAASMGAVLLAGGLSRRFCLPHSRVMIHQPLGGFDKLPTDVRAREILRVRERLNKILADHAGQPLEKIAEDTERDRFLEAEEAMNYGLVDEVLSKRPAVVE